MAVGSSKVVEWDKGRRKKQTESSGEEAVVVF